jgi:hypothetical protein
VNICIVKQHTTYDLYTKTGPDIRTVVESSNWRTGPIGLVEAFNCDFRIVWENREKECQVGKKHWGKYVEGWDIWPKGSIAEDVDEIDWCKYNIVIAIDIAVPTRIIRKYPQVMWCYYFIEGGPTAIDGHLGGSPYYGYNVFITHRLAKSLLTVESMSARSMMIERRATLDMPYYVMSKNTLNKIYPELTAYKRTGFVLSHHSYPCLAKEERLQLSKYGELNTPIQSISDIHRCELKSKYYIVHPNCKPMAGLGVIEAISAGCLVLAPKNKLWGFPELLSDSLGFDDFSQLIEVIRTLNVNDELYECERESQRNKVQEWCYINPIYNIKYLYNIFNKCTVSKVTQSLYEYKAYIESMIKRGKRFISRKMSWNNYNKRSRCSRD